MTHSAKRKLIAFLIAVPLLWATSAADELYELGVYDAENAEEDLAADITNNNVSLKETCGYSCSPPGIDFLYFYCYENIPIEVIDRTGDVVFGEWHRELKQAAREYAAVYNALALEYFDSINRRTCPVGENWTKAFHRSNEYVRDSNDSSSSFGAPSNLDGSFRASMRKPFEADALMVSICRIFLESDVRRSFTTGVHRLVETDGEFEWQHQFDFRCKSGSYERL